MSLQNQFYIVLFAHFIISLQNTLEFKKYSGSFESEIGQMKLTIVHRGDSLFVQASGNPQFQIFPKKGHNFFGKAIEIDLNFHVENGLVEGITAIRMGKKFEFKKLH